MVDKFNEVGVTNLGFIPLGMSFAEATKSVKHLRKYAIDYRDKETRLTICDTLRAMWKEVDKLQDSPEKEQIKEYIDACVSYAKSMDLRMKELKGLLNDS